MGRYDKPDNLERNGENGSNGHEEIFSRAVRAGKRTYFFDVKSTRRGDYYLTLTESKKHFGRDGRYHFEKHKVFLYKEDFEKFMDGLNETLEFCNAHNVEFVDEERNVSDETKMSSDELEEFEKKMF